MLTRKPADDEFEISIFGPGVGECIVVHLGAGKWMVVDSCVSSDSRRPVALDYFDVIGVDPATAVTTLLVTHWHDDHTSGAAELLRACAAAQFFCSSALGKKEFFELVASAGDLELVSGGGSGVDEMSRVFEILRERMTRSDGRIATPQYAAANTVIFRAGAAGNAPACVVEALSPSSGSITRGLLANAPAVLAPKRRIPNPGPNELSVAVHVQFGDVAALLGADLETGSSNAVGWRAVVTNTRIPQAKATIVKVAHHGSAGADHGPVWATLVSAAPHIGVTPFSSSRLPTSRDVERMKARSPNVFHASPARPRTVKLDKAAERALEGIKIRERRSSMGHIRFRVPRGGVVRAERFGAAQPA